MGGWRYSSTMVREGRTRAQDTRAVTSQPHAAGSDAHRAVRDEAVGEVAGARPAGAAHRRARVECGAAMLGLLEVWFAPADQPLDGGWLASRAPYTKPAILRRQGLVAGEGDVFTNRVRAPLGPIR